MAADYRAIPVKLLVVALCKPIYKLARELSTTMKRTSKWRSLGEQVAKLNDGESIVLAPEGNLAEEARKIRSGLNGIAACILVQRTVKVVDGKVVITRIEP